MIGNDVVDLRDLEVRPGSVHPRFDARVFAAAEAEILRGSAAPNRLRWTLWAAKEAAYKAARKGDARTVFAPSRFVVALTDEGRARVEHEGQLFEVVLRTRDDGVHAVATSAAASGAVLSGVAQLPERRIVDPSAAARELALVRIARSSGIDPHELTIVRRGRIPTLLRRDRSVFADLSLSHHGRFVAFACDTACRRSAA